MRNRSQISISRTITLGDARLLYSKKHPSLKRKNCNKVKGQK